MLKHTTILEAKNHEVMTVDNIIELVRNYTIAKQLEQVSELEIAKLHRHYNNMMYTALLNGTKIFERIEKSVYALAPAVDFYSLKGHFEVDVQLAVPSVGYRHH